MIENASTVSRVAASHNSGFAVGEWVLSHNGWQALSKLIEKPQTMRRGLSSLHYVVQSTSQSH